MGMMATVDPPNLDNETHDDFSEARSRKEYGTKTTPPENPQFVDLFFRSNYVMNTTAPVDSATSASSPGSPIIFLLQNELLNDYKIENPSPGYPMTVIVMLSGNGDVIVTVRDNAGGTTVGTETLIGFTFGMTPTEVHIDIPFSSGTEYTFLAGHYIEIELNFTNTGRLHYNSISAPSRLLLYGSTVPDISMVTKNFFEWPTDNFYPNDIRFPQERKKVIAQGSVTEVFGKDGEIQYIDYVQVQIQGPAGYDEVRMATYDHVNYEYMFVWNYTGGQTSGQYTVTTHVFDEQGNEFTVSGFFNISQYGVLLTSPSQVPEEGYFLAEARQNVIKYTKIAYRINAWNIGNAITVVNLTTIGQAGWDWWLEGENLTKNNGSKTDTVIAMQAGEKREFRLVVDSKDRPLGAKGTILVVATCNEDPTEDNTLQTITTVVLFQFHEGWNLLSIPFIQSDTNLSSVLSPISGSYDAVQWFKVNDSIDPWKHHQSSRPSLWNDLMHLDHTTGFWIRISDPLDPYFDYSGDPPSTNQTIQLHPGWNLVGYPSLFNYNRTRGLNNLEFGSDVDCIQWFDANDQTWHFLEEGDDFKIGMGYWIHSTVEVIWEVPF
jgi:hypothetical protein